MARRELAKRPRPPLATRVALLERPEVLARYDRIQKKWVLHVPGRCVNAAGGREGCRQCGLPASDFPAFSMRRLKEELRLFLKYARLLGVKIVKAGTFGSWKEIPEKARLLILKTLREAGIEELQVEFRPELVTREILEELREQLPGVRVAVEIGLDHHSHWARNVVLRRNHDQRDFRRAVRRVRRVGLIPVAFVAIGLPLGWREWEAVKSAIETIGLAVAVGCERIWLEPVVLQPWTLQQYLYDRGLWEPIWLWTIRCVILEVWRRVVGTTQILVGGPVHEPPPDTDSQPSNRCRKCEDQFRTAFKQVAEGSIDALRDLDCGCRFGWRTVWNRVLVPRRDVQRVLREFDVWRAAEVARRKRCRRGR